MELFEQLSRGFVATRVPSGLELEVAALREHVGPEFDSPEDLLQVRLAVQLCSIGLGDFCVQPGGIPTPASEVVAEAEAEEFVERRIRGWAGLN